MRVGLRRHLVVVFFLFALALLAATLIPFSVAATRAHLTSYTDDRLLEAQRAAASLRPGVPAAPVLRDRYPAGGPTAFWLLDPKGAPVGEPSDPMRFPAVVARAPELEEARGGRATEWVGATPGGHRLLIAYPLLRDGRVSGVLWLSSSLGPVERLNVRTWVTAAGVGAAALVAAVVVGFALARRLTRRLRAVHQGAVRFGAGRLDEPITVAGHDEIAALATRLNEMAAQIDHLMRLEKDFVAAASHQIRTPLAVIKVRIDEIRALTSSDPPQVAEDLDDMAEEIDRLSGLASRLLTLSAAERLEDAEPVASAAAPAIRGAIGRIEPLAALHGVTLSLKDVPQGVSLIGPRAAFEEVLINLLDNAVKFSPEGGLVEIRTEQDGGFLLVAVRDEGPGVPEEKRHRVFEPFYRATREGRGHGLGLAISSRLCEAAGATISLDPAPGVGTVARVRWPLQPGREAERTDLSPPLYVR
jgi:two-component system, OmpR family, sensor kinase